MAFITDEEWMRLALDATDQECMARTGMLRTRVIQKALYVAQDPDVALRHPELVARVQERVAVQREARSVRKLGR